VCIEKGYQRNKKTGYIRPIRRQIVAYKFDGAGPNNTVTANMQVHTNTSNIAGFSGAVGGARKRTDTGSSGVQLPVKSSMYL